MNMMVSPYRFAASGGTGDVTLAVQDFTDPTSTGNQDWTTSALTGITPVAALVISTNHRSADSGERAGAHFAIGAMDGSTQAAVWACSRDNLADTAVGRMRRTTQVHCQVDLGPNITQAATGSLISGGLRFNYTAVTSGVGAIRGAYIAFAGADVRADHGSINLGTGTSAISVTTSDGGGNFAPDVVIFYGACNSSSDAIDAAHALSFGVALSDGTQRCVIWVEGNGVATGSPYQTLYNNRCGGQLDNTNGSLSYHVTAGGFGSSGFQVTPSANTASDILYYLALKFTGRRVAIKDFDTPTSTGSQALTGVGFLPRFALAALTNLEAVNTVVGSTSDNQGGFAISLIGNEQWAGVNRMDSGATTTDTGARLENSALLGASATSTNAIVASLTSFDSDGLTFNYSAVQGTAKKGFMLCVE